MRQARQAAHLSRELSGKNQTVHDGLSRYFCPLLQENGREMTFIKRPYAKHLCTFNSFISATPLGGGSCVRAHESLCLFE